MNKKPPIFKHLRNIYNQSPWVLVTVLWVSILPSIGAIILGNWIYSHWSEINLSPIIKPEIVLIYCISGTFLMGLALVPTTFFAVISGYVFGWQTFPYLVLAYTLASAVGYYLGRILEKDSLDLLLAPYPKAKKLISEKKGQMGSLIFFVRISPVIPFAISNLVFAMLRTGIKRVLWFGFLGMLPRTLLAFSSGALAGSLQEALTTKSPIWQYVLIVALLVVSLVGIYTFFTKSASKN
ncbi:VTT domain-containing protein [Cyclobacterium marinum]|uniref:TVP38/TMEM64 family protein n=1 Tax=Cyclobacterium marinum TaxID=104 RepID=UPI0030DB87B1|tara:strand:- start:88227 stop:88940 length:714 start_codon:yes stop_codon:yes gene_type:complete